jgi:C1A family cysteine protease
MGNISCPDAGINHVVLLYGYNQTHWFIKNSWGTGWGDKGHAYILNTKNCKIDKWVDIMQVNFPTPMPVVV